MNTQTLNDVQFLVFGIPSEKGPEAPSIASFLMSHPRMIVMVIGILIWVQDFLQKRLILQGNKNNAAAEHKTIQCQQRQLQATHPTNAAPKNTKSPSFLILAVSAVVVAIWLGVSVHPYVSAFFALCVYVQCFSETPLFRVRPLDRTKMASYPTTATSAHLVR